MKVIINRKLLSKMKDFNAFKDIRSFGSLDNKEIQQALIIDATIKYLQSIEIIDKNLEVEIGDL